MSQAAGSSAAGLPHQLPARIRPRANADVVHVAANHRARSKGPGNRG